MNDHSKGENNMLEFNELKKEINDGYSFIEHAGKWYEYQYMIIVENDTVMFEFDRNYLPNFWIFETTAHFTMSVNEFMAIKSYKEYVRKMDELIHYNEAFN